MYVINEISSSWDMLLMKCLQEAPVMYNRQLRKNQAMAQGEAKPKVEICKLASDESWTHGGVCNHPEKQRMQRNEGKILRHLYYLKGRGLNPNYYFFYPAWTSESFNITLNYCTPFIMCPSFLSPVLNHPQSLSSLMQCLNYKAWLKNIMEASSGNC